MSTMQHILTLNLGSSTLKAALYQWPQDGDSNTLVRVGGRFEISLTHGMSGDTDDEPLLDSVAASLPDPARPPDVITYRIVHGGSFTGPAWITDSVLTELAAYIPMDPLHQPRALRLVKASRQRWPEAKHLAVFDTTWHQSLAAWSRRLPIPQRLHDAGIKRYGFHGLAFQSAIRELRKLDDTIAGQRIVLAHLGSGCSLCAVQHGRSVDTTMGLTPLDGLPMATRSGALDPGVLLFLAHGMNMPTDDIEHMLWRESGLLAISGRGGDMRHLLEAPDARCVLAVDHFVMRVAQGIASMATSIGGLDALVFTGGIGSNSPAIRKRISEQLAWTGLLLDEVRNLSGDVRIDAAKSSIKMWTLKVDEEYELALAALNEFR